MAIQKLRNNKSPGEDCLQAELFKHGGKELCRRMHESIGLIWERERMPKEWKTGIICPLYKKGDPLTCANYRGITLLNIAYKIMTAILYRNLLPYVEK